MEKALMEKVVSFMETNKLIEPGDSIVAGISGGADSVCLLFLLCELREKYDTQVTALHVHHGIRKEAGEDAAFVEKLCKELKVPFVLVKEDVPAKAKEWGCSEEEAGRRVRYEAFEKEAEGLIKKYKGKGSVKIAVAHNMNDNAETVLFNLFRGSALKGLTGIPVIREGRFPIIRPLLCLERCEIEEILKSEGCTFVTDATNALDIYSRNKIRHNVLPVAEEIAAGAVKRISGTAKILSETEDFLEESERKGYEACLIIEYSGKDPEVAMDNESAGEIVRRVDLDTKKLSELHPAIKKRILHRALRLVTRGGKDIGSLQIEQLLELVDNPGNRSLDLARGVRAVREYDKLIVEKKESETLESSPELGKLSYEVLSDGNAVTEEFVRKESEANKYTKYMDYDKIDGPIELRSRRSGDYIMIKDSKGRPGKKSLKKFMIDEKIPASEREKIPVVAVADKCIWLVGYRMSDDMELTFNNEKIIRLEYER